MKETTEKKVRLMVNGEWIERGVRPDLTLLRFLRDVNMMQSGRRKRMGRRGGFE